jgi:hypothetical protein
MRDFTIEKFQELCKCISSSDYHLYRVRDYLISNTLPERFIIIRHDVDNHPRLALRMAEIERNFDIISTYYFRMENKVFNPTIIRTIADMGHEIGYHYEVLDKAKGDIEKAIKIFEEELNLLRTACDVDTICMHGNPRTPWRNQEIWKYYDFRTYDIIGEAYLSIVSNNILYLSDTGRNWSKKYKVKDIVPIQNDQGINVEINSTNDVIQLIKNHKANHIYLLTHPRWARNFGEWLKELICQNLKNTVKILFLKYI